MQPVFGRERMASYGAVMVECAVRVRRNWSDRVTPDIWWEMKRLSMIIVGKALFDAEIAGEAKEIDAALASNIALSYRATTPFSAILDRLPLPSNHRAKKAPDRLDTWYTAWYASVGRDPVFGGMPFLRWLLFQGKRLAHSL